MAGVADTLEKWLINGVAITIPLVLTLIILLFILEFVLNVISPVVTAVAMAWPNEPPTYVIQATTLLSLFAAFLIVGIVAEYTPGERVSQIVHRSMEAIPGVSTLYLTIRRASEILVDEDTDQFQEVKVIEFPHREGYMLGFLTADTPETIEDATGSEEMLTIMVPLGPNPTTNGFIMHMPRENVYDVDISVEEAIRSIATLGVATNSVDEDE